MSATKDVFSGLRKATNVEEVSAALQLLVNELYVSDKEKLLDLCCEKQSIIGREVWAEKLSHHVGLLLHTEV